MAESAPRRMNGPAPKMAQKWPFLCMHAWFQHGFACFQHSRPKRQETAMHAWSGPWKGHPSPKRTYLGSHVAGQASQRAQLIATGDWRTLPGWPDRPARAPGTPQGSCPASMLDHPIRAAASVAARYGNTLRVVSCYALHSDTTIKMTSTQMSQNTCQTSTRQVTPLDGMRMCALLALRCHQLRPRRRGRQFGELTRSVLQHASARTTCSCPCLAEHTLATLRCTPPGVADCCPLTCSADVRVKRC